MLKAAGYHVLAYTVNDPVLASKLLSQGVVSVFSDQVPLLSNAK